jgi:death-on-curing protein
MVRRVTPAGALLYVHDHVSCMDIFLDLNGVTLTCGEDEAITFIYRHLEAGTFTKDVLDAWLRGNVARR